MRVFTLVTPELCNYALKYKADMHYSFVHSPVMDAPTFFDKLLILRGLNPTSLATSIRIKTAQSGFDRFRKGLIKQPKRGKALELAAARLGVDVLAFYDEELADREWERVAGDAIGSSGSRESDISSAPTNVIQNVSGGSDTIIRQFGTGGSIGGGLVLQDQPGVIRELRVSDRWIQENVRRVTSIKNLCVVTGFGPSMQPMFNPGDPLLVDTGVIRVDVDGIYFFRVGEEGYVKQVQRIPTANGTIYRAKSYNENFDPFDITPGMDFQVFGRVVKVWKSEEIY